MDGLRALRLRRLLTQTELAERLGVRYQTVGAWESGQARPRVSAMRKLCEVLDVTPDVLLAALEESRREGKEAA
ncbi:MAG TPA: helix-turn-helix transcriptional regulator [Thermomicrobiales bacterium]|nr:helix-turn-helix transcriptional regulator [Thermomicrobiales bacterium]